jgi:hypothetical protein
MRHSPIGAEWHQLLCYLCFSSLKVSASRSRQPLSTTGTKPPTSSPPLRMTYSLLQIILLPRPLLDRGPLPDAINPLEQMRERTHLLLGEATPLPALDPRPRPDVRNGVLALSLASQVVARLARVFTREVDLEHAVDAEGFVSEAVDRICVAKSVLI